MRCWKIAADIVNLINHKISAMLLSFILCICLAGPGVLQKAYGQGSLVETVGTMEISQQVDNGANQATPKRAADMAKPAKDANNVPQQPSRNPTDMRRNPAPPQAPPPEVQQQVQAPAVVETAAAAPAVTADTNVFDANDFNAFKREIDRIDMSARGEDSQWLGKQEKKAELAQAMNNVVVAELGFLRKVAAAANDVNAVEAIDLVLKKRRDRLQKLVTKLENELNEERQPRERKTPRTGGMQQQTQTSTQSSPERSTGGAGPARRARSTVGAD
jgi:hypothetical protein